MKNNFQINNLKIFRSLESQVYPTGRKILEKFTIDDRVEIIDGKFLKEFFSNFFQIFSDF